MRYLTAQHTTPPFTIEHEDIQYPVKRLIELEDTATLALLGIYPHETAPGNAPLGYTDWMLVGGTYTREPAGTQEERDAAAIVLAYQLAEAQRQEQTPEILDKITKILVAPIVKAGELDDAAVAELGAVGAFPLWQPNVVYAVGDVLTYQSEIVECLQAHTSQVDWTPDIVPALFKIYRPAGTVAEWVQPTGAQDAYQIDDQVTHNGSTWISIAANNVWEPGVYGWEVML